MKVKLLYKTPNMLNPTYTFEVNGITTKTLMALSRHQGIQLTVQSSRYTMKKSIKNSDNDLNLITLSKVDEVRDLQIKQINEICDLVASNPELPQDDLNLLLPQGYKYNLVMTANSEKLEHFYNLRNNKTHAHWDIQDLAEKLNDEIYINVNNNDFKEFTPLSVVARAIRKCYSTEDKSDNGGEKDLSLIKRVAITSKHSSVLRHCIIPIPYKDMILTKDKYYYYTEDFDGNEYLVYNLQELVESDNCIMIETLIPKGYHYLLNK